MSDIESDNESYFSEGEGEGEAEEENEGSVIGEEPQKAADDLDEEIIEDDIANEDSDYASDIDDADDESEVAEDDAEGIDEYEDEGINEDMDLVVPGKKAKKIAPLNIVDTDSEEEDEDDENYLQKFDTEINKNYVVDFHPECFINNYDEIAGLTKVVRDTNNNIIDPLHRTIPFMTKYERTRVIGQRAKQINSGAKPFVKVPEKIIDGYLIAELELMQKRIPFIIRRPIPGGTSEYWNLKDLEVVSF